MEWLGYFSENHDKLLYIIASVSLVIELAIIGLSGPLLFFAIGCGVTGLLVSLGIVSGWEMEVLCVGLLSLLSAVFLWKPLKKFQGTAPVQDTSSDMIGQVVPVSGEVTPLGGSIRHSGINWQARLDDQSPLESIEVDSRVEIVGVDGNVMIVRELSG